MENNKDPKKILQPQKSKTEGKSSEKVQEKEKMEDSQPKSFKGMINAYGFIHLSKDARKAFGASKGAKTDVTIDLQNGALIIKRA
jgi:hypothetical protein